MSFTQSLFAVVMVALVVLFVVLVILGGPVSRDRLERFALRQQLLVTPDNGARVIRYLSVTRRWRSAGVILGFVVPIVVSATRHYLTGPTPQGNGFAWLFAGWFVGALVAEFRVNGGPTGSHRVASLYARTMRRYMGWSAWILLVAVTTVAVAVTLSRAVRAPTFDAITPGAIAAVTAVVVWFVARRVLIRAQPHLPADELAADDAIRSRSLHVLCGSGIAVTTLCLAQLLGQTSHGTHGGLRVVLTFFAVVAGWNIATARFHVRVESAAASEVAA